jgi:1-deoxy-D-xylulose-5-phosphate reductoisomerase
MAAVGESGTELLPVDSEHSAAFPVLAGATPASIERILLTASGGPFRQWTRARLEQATPEEALRHPNWSMGRKISIDSATLMNKGLELIEAYHLFPIEAHQIDVVVHPQSIVHCLVQYRDGSMLAQMATPDMRTPIACALAWPERMSVPAPRVDLAKLASLTFEPPDVERFPAFGLARTALEQGGAAPAVLNAANEVAVAAFLDRKLGFLQIDQLVADTLERAAARGLLAEPHSLEDVLTVDAAARALARELL